MTDGTELVALPGSIPSPRGTASPTRSIDPTSLVEVTVYLRPRTEPAPGVPLSPIGGRFLSRSELAATRGAAPREVTAVESFARSHSLDVIEIDPAARRVRLRASASLMAATFGVELLRYDHPDGPFRTHLGPVMLPREFDGVIMAVLGLDDRPQAATHYRRSKDAAAPSYTPAAIAELYGCPTGATAPGVCVALIELGGGFAPTDIDAYFKSLGIAAPTVTAVGVDGASNKPTGSTSGPDTEVMLDIEVVGAIARQTNIAVYFSPNTDQGFADAILAAVHDTARHPHIISISWGGPESTYTAQATSVFEAAFTDAASVGVTVFVAAGDNGSSDGVSGSEAHVDYPASSPQVVGCGGTHVNVVAGAISSEVVWDDLPAGGATGGGVSATFAVPTWQASTGVPPSANPGGGSGRGVPDVSGDADPETGYQIRVDGDDIVVGGTSAVAPLYAGITALAVAQVGGPLGFINPHLYPLGAKAFRDITSGTNGAYDAGVGWDPCTGLGSPKAAALIAALVQSAKDVTG
jgi:kumamolisin